MNAPSQSALSHLKFRHLQLITHLVQLGTLHKAARALSISQPAATAMLSDLESTIGVRLFERSHRGVQATIACEQLADSVRTLLNDFAELTETVGRISEGKERLLRVGLVPQVFATYFPQVITEFRSNGGCALRTQEGTARSLLNQLWEGTLDCVIGRLPNTGVPEAIDIEALRFEGLYSESISVVCGAAMSHECRRGPIFEWLASKEWVLQRRDSSVRQALNEAFLRMGVAPPTPVVETTNYMQSLSLVSNSSYLTVAPTHAANSYQEQGSVRVLDLDLKVAPMQVNCITRIASDGNEQIQLFIEAFKKIVDQAPKA